MLNKILAGLIICVILMFIMGEYFVLVVLAVIIIIIIRLGADIFWWGRDRDKW